jgi:hypothetical protein
MPLVKPMGEHGDECVCRGSLVDDGLDARAVLGDAKAALPLLVEVGGEVDSASLLVVEENSSEGRRRSGMPSSRVHDHPHQLLRDGAVHPSF